MEATLLYEPCLTAVGVHVILTKALLVKKCIVQPLEHILDKDFQQN